MVPSIDMGSQVSIEAFDPAHVRIYNNIIQIQNPQTRAQMIQTCLTGGEFVAASKRGGVYSYLLGYVSAVQSGHNPRPLPGEGNGGLFASAVRIPPMGITQVPRSMEPPPQLQMKLTSYKEKAAEGPAWQHLTISREKKAVSYFASCLEVLGIQDEVALTEESLKKAYKRLAVKAHPDKGGSEEHFEAITRAYAYLTEIIRRLKGGREAEGKVEAPAALKSTRGDEAENWKHVEPVKLNPKNLDMNAFNKMFENTHMPDPDNDGYGDWLKTAGGAEEGPKFGGKFNRDVFNNMFDDEARKRGAAAGQEQRNNALMLHPDAMAMLPTMGVEIGRDRPETYTAAPNSRQQFTDLRAAYTTDSTFSGQVANVRVEERKFETYRANRESAPVPLSHHEREALHGSEKELQMREQMRQRRAAERGVMEQSYFDRMKQLVITDKT